MAKILGWIFILLGIALIIVKGLALTALKLPFKQVLGKIPFLANLNVLWAVIIGLILIAAGLLFLKQKPQEEKEVPIYEGTGKKRKIVGYRKVK